MPKKSKSSFGELFKKYRLKSQFKTLKELGEILSKNGFYFEDSLLSKWQTGKRVPNDRKIMLVFICIFAENGGIKDVSEANQFLESAGFGFLTEKEKENLLAFFRQDQKPSLCQTPYLTKHFIGRKAELQKIGQILKNEPSPMIAICGPGGVGKSALAIEAARLFGNHFPDAVLWSKLSTTDPMSILSKIAFTFGENVTSVKDLESRSEIVRSILSDKKALLIFDDVESSSQLRYLLPGETKSAIIATSRCSDLEVFLDAFLINLPSFSKEETRLFFQNRLGKSWFSKNQNQVEKISQLLGSLPLALNIILNRIVHRKGEAIDELAKVLEREKSKLKLLAHEEVSVRSSFEVSFSSLNKEMQKLFESLAVFGGDDFSLEAVAFVNKLEHRACHELLNQLCGKSLIECSQPSRFSLHPLLKLFAQEKLMRREPFLRAAKYYADFLRKTVRQKQFSSYELLNKELDNVLSLCHWTFNNKELDLFLGLWENASRFIAEVGLWDELEKLGLLVYQSPSLRKYQKIRADCCINVLSWINFWKGNLGEAKDWAREGLEIAKKLKDPHLFALAQNRLGYVYAHEGNSKKAEELLGISIKGFKKVKDLSQISQSLRYLTYIPYKK